MRTLPLAGLLFAVAALALGCGDDDDDNGTTAGAAGSPGAGSGGVGGSAGAAGGTSGSGVGGRSGSGGGSGSGGSSGASGQSGGSGAGGSSGAPGTATLTGTWDIVGSYQRGGSGTGVVRLSENDFTFSYFGGTDHLAGRSTRINISSVRFDATNGALIALDGNGEDFIVGKHVAGEPMRLGAVPLPLDGVWTLASDESPNRFCTTTLSKLAAGIRCQGVSELPDWEGADALTISHVAEAASMFGDLGGTWRAARVQSNSPESTCELRLEGGDVTLTCAKLSMFSGTLRLSFNGDQLSGSTDKGLEFAGTRR